MAPSEEQQFHLGVSTAGNRTHKLNASDTMQNATSRVLRVVEDKSAFFDTVEPFTLPAYESSEIETGAFLGRGEFGDVWEVSAIHDEVDYTCNFDRPDDGEKPFESRPAQIEIIEVASFNEKKQGTLSISKLSARHNHRRAISAVSFADGVKEAKEVLPPKKHSEEPERQHDGKQKRIAALGSTIDLAATLPFSNPTHEFIDNSDNSTLSTGEEESVTNIMESDGFVDGEVIFLRHYMSTHTTRQGIARYAIKRVRHDLTQDAILEAVVDLAVEAKFLATMRHPNIVRMRATVGTPGTEGFMIVMDRLQMTLREKMDIWNRESKGQSMGLLGKLLGHKGNTAVQREQYADKLLAAYDVARAMRYLHNHMIIFRDLKPENVAVDVRGDMRLFDFGLVKELKQKDLLDPPDGFAATGLTGSRRYMAPEVCSCKNYGLKADVYSFGVVFWEIFAGQDAYSKMSFDKHFDQVVVKGKRPSTKAAASNCKHLSQSLLHLMPDMWNASPSERPTFKNVCDRLAGECLLSSTRPPRGMDGIRDSDQSHQSYLSDRTRYLMNRSLRSRLESDIGDIPPPNNNKNKNTTHGSSNDSS